MQIYNVYVKKMYLGKNSVSNLSGCLCRFKKSIKHLFNLKQSTYDEEMYAILRYIMTVCFVFST